MDVKRYLTQGLWLDQSIKSKLEQLEALKSLAMKVNATLVKEKVSGGNRDHSSMEKTIVKIVDLEKEINEDIDRLVNLKKEIQDTINKLGDLNYQLLLEMRYIQGKSWEEVAMCLDYDRRTIFRIHGKALKEIEKMQVVTKCH